MHLLMIALLIVLALGEALALFSRCASSRGASRPIRIRLLASTPDWDRPDYVPPKGGGGSGEWADWDSDSFVGDGDAFEPEQDVDVDVSAPAVAVEDAEKNKNKDEEVKADTTEEKSFGQWSGSAAGRWGEGDSFKNDGKSPSEQWEGWSEEPPYFDDDDILEDTNVEFASTSFSSRLVGKNSQSSDLWTRQTPDWFGTTNAQESFKTEATVASSFVPPPITTAVASAAVAVTDPSAVAASSQLPASINELHGSSRLDMMETKIEKLRQDLSDTRQVLALCIGIVLGAGLQSLFSK